MKKVSRFVALLALIVTTGSANAALIQFDFDFDTVFNGIPLEGPIVGSGQVSFDDVGNGTFMLSGLTNLSMQFFLPGQTFDLSDATTPLTEALALVTDFGSGRRFQFSNILPIGTGGSTGSIDFVNSNGAVLTFEPPIFTGNLDLYQVIYPTGPAIEGSYLATVPLPSTLALFALGLLAMRRRINA